MLKPRDWKPQEFQARIGEYLYSFSGFSAELSMAPINEWSEDWKLVPDCEATEWVYPEQEIIHLLVENFKQVSEVQSICAQFGPEEITVWTLLESYDRTARSQVHSKELEICRALSVYDFDFRVTSVDLVSPEELCSAGLLEIYKRP